MTERVSVVVIPILILCCVSIIVLYEMKIAQLEDDQDSQHPWFVPRSEWMAVEPASRGNATTSYEPLRLVVILNSVTHECRKFLQCATAMKELQGTFLIEHKMDTPYNFFIGNDGRVYEGRGWGVQGSQCLQFEPCALVIGFFGDYREATEGGFSRVTELQLNNTLKLLELGVQEGHLHEDYVVAGAKDLLTSQNPGYYLYNAIKKWKHYDGGRYKELTCDQIHLLKSDDVLDIAPHEWRISREMWGAKSFAIKTESQRYTPLRLVILQQTVSRECHSYVICQIEIQNMQTWFSLSEQDIPYNFIIANDGRVYEARGWGVDPANCEAYNNCSISIAFIGDYSEELNYNSKVTKGMLNRTQMILQEGVRLGRLHPDYVIVGAKDMFQSNGPGDNLYSIIKSMDRYGLRYQGMTCDEIAQAYKSANVSIVNVTN